VYIELNLIKYTYYRVSTKVGYSLYMFYYAIF